MGPKKFGPPKPTIHTPEKKKLCFLRRPQIVHAFSNIPFWDPCHGAQTGLRPEDPKKRVFGGKNSFTFLSKPQEPAIVFALYLLNARAK